MSIELRKRDGKNEEGWGYPVGAGVVGMKGGHACVGDRVTGIGVFLDQGEEL